MLELEALPRIAWTTRRTAQFDLPDPPLVSVVIATYNWSSVLRHSIASALGQTYPRVEVVVVGDACTDDSERVAASFGDPRVRWHNLAENSGSQSLPNNKGIELARGEYVAYLGHDDVWLPGHLSHVMKAVLGTGADLGFAVTERIGPPGSGIRQLSGHSISGRPHHHQIVRPSSLVHRTSLVDDIGPWRDYRTIVDPPDDEFVARAWAAGMAFACSNALTVFKFSSAMRPNSYVEKPSHEQAEYSRRIAGERFFLAREYALVTGATVRALLRPSVYHRGKLSPPPGPLPPGWQVTEMRRIRGLEP